MLLDVTTQLLPDGKTIAVNKTYKNRESYELYKKIWRNCSKDGVPDEYRLLDYEVIIS